MNIMFVPIFYLPSMGGVQICVNKLSKQFISQGHKVNVVTFKFPNHLKSRQKIDGIDVDRLYLPPLRLLRTNLFRFIYLIFSTPFIVFRLYKLTKKNRPHIINVQYEGLNAYYVLLLSYVYRFTLIVTLQGFSVIVIPFLKKKKSWVFNKVLDRADYIISCSQSLLEDAQKYVPGIKNKSVVIPNGFDPTEFAAADVYLSSRPYIFSLGRFHRIQKGFDILIMAFKTIIDKGYDVDLIIAGEGPEREDYENLVKLLRLEDRVKFFGKASRNDVVRLFKGCEFFVLPSRIEGFPLVNLEAMAAGKAVVAAKVNGVPEVVKDGINGILVEPRNDKALAEGIMRLLEDKELRQRLADKGQEIVQEYSWDRISDKYLDIYKYCINNVSIK